MLSRLRGLFSNVCIRPDQIAAELTRHWGKVFGNANIDEAALQEWLRQAIHPPNACPPTNAARWHKRKKDVARAIRCSGNSMPGPDRIPYVAWKRLGPLAVDVLFGAATAMAKADFPQRIRQAYCFQEGEDHPFNLGLLVCIPKKWTSTTPNTEQSTRLREHVPCPLWTQRTASSLMRAATGGNPRWQHGSARSNEFSFFDPGAPSWPKSWTWRKQPHSLR